MEASTEERQREGDAPQGEQNGDGRQRNVGRVEEITGVVIEAVFPEQLPEIYAALEIEMQAAGEGEASPSIGKGSDGDDGDSGGGGERETKTLVCEV